MWELPPQTTRAGVSLACLGALLVLDWVAEVESRLNLPCCPSTEKKMRAEDPGPYRLLLLFFLMGLSCSRRLASKSLASHEAIQTLAQ